MVAMIDMPASDPSPGTAELEMVEFELALDLQEAGKRSFGDAVADAAAAVSGEVLFDMPAGGLIEDCQRVAAVRVKTGRGGHALFLALLDEAGSKVRVERPDPSHSSLMRFAGAFVDLLEGLQPIMVEQHSTEEERPGDAVEDDDPGPTH